MTVCNMSIEAGAEPGSRRTRPSTTSRARPCAEGRTGTPPCRIGATLATDEDAEFDAEVVIDATEHPLSPFVTWGTNPGQGCPPRQCCP